MKHLRLMLRCTLCLGILVLSNETPAAPSQIETALPEKNVDDKRLEAPFQQIQPAVVLVTVFDPSGKLLRSGTGFFVSETGRIITTWRTVEGALNGVAKTANDAIYNINGVVASSTKLDLAVLQADAKKVQPLVLNENNKPEPGTRVTVVGSVLAGSEGAPMETTIAEANPNELRLATAVPEITLGAPVVDENGAVIGIVTARAGNEATSSIARPITAAKTLVADISANATARWPAARPSPSPRPRLVYTPRPVYPVQTRFRDGAARNGRYRINFDSTGVAKNVQVVTSTGSDVLDAAAIKGLQQWRTEPGRESYVDVPLTFQSR